MPTQSLPFPGIGSTNRQKILINSRNVKKVPPSSKRAVLPNSFCSACSARLVNFIFRACDIKLAIDDLVDTNEPLQNRLISGRYC